MTEKRLSVVRRGFCLQTFIAKKIKANGSQNNSNDSLNFMVLVLILGAESICVKSLTKNRKMDILSERGKQSAQDEQVAASIFVFHNPSFKYIETPKNKPSAIDALLFKDDQVQAVVETKCRYDCDVDKFMGNYRANWLVTYDKIMRGHKIAQELCVPFVGFLYLVQSEMLLVARLSDSEGIFLCNMEIMPTQTQKNINGGTITRNNAFIDMSNATFYERLK